MATTDHVFLDGDVPLAARVHRPDGKEKNQAVIVMGSWLTVKEQMADLYAAALAERGYTAVTFDFAGFGASGGTLRQTEIPTRKMANLNAAVRWVSTNVSPGPPAALAVCASAQYTLAAIAAGTEIASFASVAGWFHDAESIGTFYGGAEGVAARLARASAAARTRTEETVPAYAPDDDRAGMFIEMDYYANPSRGAVPQWRNEMTELTWDHWLTFDGLRAAANAPADVPSLFVHSDDCVFPQNVRKVIETLPGPVTTAWGEGQQIDFYDQKEQTEFALDAVHHHFEATMGVSR